MKKTKHLHFEQAGPISLGCTIDVDGEPMPIQSLAIRVNAARLPNIQLVLTDGHTVIPTGMVKALTLDIEFEDRDQRTKATKEDTDRKTPRVKRKRILAV